MGKLYTRRSLMGLPVVAAVAATGLVATPAKASAGRRIQSFLDLVGQDPRAYGGGAFEGWQGTDYHWGGSAASANLKVLRGSLGLAPVAWAAWQLIWNPQNPLTSVRLVSFEPGGAGFAEFASIGPDPRISPIVTGRMLTDEINALLAQGKDIDIGHQARGNGAQGPLIFSSYLELVWEV